jgi:nucleoside-diphosphate-sugar epimerase
MLTGNLGYVGSVVSPFLVEQGKQVFGVDTGYYADALLTPAQDAPTRIHDVRDLTVAQLQQFDAVVHLAALSNDPTGDLNPQLTDEINHRATVRLATMAKKAGVRRFVFASSCSLYGVAGDAPVDESAEFNPQTAYAKSKVDAEAGLNILAADDFSPTYLRFATAYGLSPRLRFDIVANNLTGWAVSTGKVRLLSDGSAWRPLVHVRDMARSILAVLDAPREAIHNQALNVGTDADNFRVREIAEAVQSVTECEVEFAPGASADNRSYRVSFDKIRQRLPQFAPAESLASGVEEMHRCFIEVGMPQSKFESDAFTRLKRLRRLLNEGRLNASLRPVGVKQSAV